MTLIIAVLARQPIFELRFRLAFPPKEWRTLQPGHSQHRDPQPKQIPTTKSSEYMFAIIHSVSRHTGNPVVSDIISDMYVACAIPQGLIYP